MFDAITLLDYGRPLAARKAARRYVGPYTWRPSAPGNGRGFYSGSHALTMDPRGSSLALRLEDANDHLRDRRRFVSGYYADDYQDATLEPIIARLPSGRGFLAGWTMGANMCGSLEPEVYPDAASAASAAHDAAEYAAEREREQQQSEAGDED
jgi:hypothetical protein